LNTGNVVVLKIVARFNYFGRGRNYDVTPDGKRFVVVTSADSESPDATPGRPRSRSTPFSTGSRN